MSEQIKFIIQELNKEPFSKKLNIISFDALRNENLLKVLLTVFAYIDPKMSIELKVENPDQIAIRLLNFLRILKYKPPLDIDLSTFRQGLISGDKLVIYHILEWALQRLPELKKRAYLARFLVKIDLSTDVEGDADVVELYNQYVQLIEKFKEVHKHHENLSNSGFSTQEIRKDIGHMEEEREQLIKKVERHMRRVDSHPQKDQMLDVCKNLREEQDKHDRLQRQKAELKGTIVHADQKMIRLNQRLKDARHLSLGTTPEGLLNKLEEEVRVNTYMVKEKLPKEMSTQQKYVYDLHKVILEPALGVADLDLISTNLQIVNTEINHIIEKRMMSNDPLDDKLSLFRQQASIINRRKEAAAEELNEAKNKLAAINEEINVKQEQTKGSNTEEVLKGEEFKRYVNKLRSTSTIYKSKRQELSELKSECGILARTIEILSQREKNIKDSLVNLEERKGVGGFHTTQEELEKVSSQKSELDEKKNMTLSEMSNMVRRLNAKIAEKKASLAPIIKELRPLRQRCQDLTMEFDKKKSSYDSYSAGLDSNLSKLEQEVKGSKKEVAESDSKAFYHKCMIDILHAEFCQIQEELKNYVTQGSSKKTLRDQFTKKLQEQEDLSKQLKEHQKQLKENQVMNQYQMKLWSSLNTILEFKATLCKNQANPVLMGNASVDRLIL